MTISCRTNAVRVHACCYKLTRFQEVVQCYKGPANEDKQGVKNDNSYDLICWQQPHA